MYVVETDDATHLGYLHASDGELRVSTGSAGHPVTVRLDELVSVTVADEHPAVVEA